MKVKDIKFGDIVTYRSGRANNVNNPYRYSQYFNDNFENVSKGIDFDIMRIQRYIKIFGFYKLKTIYRRYK